MFDLSIPWWELVVRAAAVYAVLLLLVRLSGRRSVGQFTPFDLLVVMLISESVGNALDGGEDSVLGAWISAATLIALNAVVGLLASRSRRMEALLEGNPVLLARDGQVFDAVLRRHRISPADIEKALRAGDCRREDMKFAFLEADGNINILKR